jgi:hypothetical protein
VAAVETDRLPGFTAVGIGLTTNCFPTTKLDALLRHSPGFQLGLEFSKGFASN